MPRPLSFILLVVAAMLVFSLLRKNDAGGPEVVPWRTDLQAALEEATRSNKPVLAYFTASWCPPCQRMKSTTWQDLSVARALEAWVPVKLDVDQHRDLARRYQINGVPTLLILSAGGTVGQARSGYASAEELVAWLSRSHQ